MLGAGYKKTSFEFRAMVERKNCRLAEHNTVAKQLLPMFNINLCNTRCSPLGVASTRFISESIFYTHYSSVVSDNIFYPGFFDKSPVGERSKTTADVIRSLTPLLLTRSMALCLEYGILAPKRKYSYMLFES